MTYRDEILKLMASADYRPMRRRALAKELGVTKKHYGEFREALGELEDEGLVTLGRGRRYLPAARDEDLEGTAGTFIAKGDFGFVRPEGGGEDYYVGREHTGGAMDGDRVLLEPRRRGRGPRRRGRVTKVLERAASEVVGVLRRESGWSFILPGEREGNEGVKVVPGPGQDARELPYGHKVAARITRYPTRSHGAAAEFVEDLGPAGSVETETAAVIRELGLHEEFPPEALAEAEELPEALPGDEPAHRADYRSQPCITIDPPDAADFDDAIYIEAGEKGGWRLYVHIADVAWAVPPGGALDREARARATSTYLPGRVLPMLPPRVSSALCSLVPGQARLTQTVVIDYDAGGGRLGYRIERSLIRSALRLNYGQVRRLIEGAPEPGEEVPADALDLLGGMHSLSQKLRARRSEAGSIFLEVPEVRVRVGENGETLAVEERRQDLSHQIVEEFMLAANRAVAEYLVAAELPGVFRLHEEPDEEKLRELSTFVKSFGLSLKPPFSRKNIQKLVESVRDTEREPAVMLAVLTSLKQARYAGAEGPHYALAFRPYCHFTSPIRRYPDLVVHRALGRLYQPGQPALAGLGRGGRRRGRRAQVADRRAAAAAMETLAAHCSQMERRAEQAERRLTRFRQLELLKRQEGAEHWGTITGVAEFGLFVKLDGFYVEGLVHVAGMVDRYRYLPRRRELVGERTGRRWRLGDRVAVRLVRLDMAAARLDLELAPGGAKP